MSFANKDLRYVPGSIIDGMYCFPTLYKIDAHGNKKQYNIFIRMIKAPESERKYGIDWSIFEDEMVHITMEHITGEDSVEDCLVQGWTETGNVNGKITRHPPKFYESKNVGKKNERNGVQTALIKYAAEYKKKKEAGMTEDASGVVVASDMYFPMKSYKWDEKKMDFPIFVQPKLDGVRAIAYLRITGSNTPEDTTPGDVVIYSSARKVYTGYDDIADQLHPLLKRSAESHNGKIYSLYLDGELYIHGEPLQVISGDARQESGVKKNQFHIFDSFYPFLDEDCKTRLTRVRRLLNDARAAGEFGEEKKEKIKEVPTYRAKDKEELDNVYQTLIDEGYEGVMCRSPNGVYATSNTSESAAKSANILKMKQEFDDEWPVVGFTQGDGRDKGAIIWIIEVNGKKVNIQPKDISLQERYALYEDAAANFNRKYKGRLMTVSYGALSTEGIPLRAKAVRFRAPLM